MQILIGMDFISISPCLGWQPLVLTFSLLSVFGHSYWLNEMLDGLLLAE